MGESVFHFKKFKVLHGRGSMKVGVDAVLLGCWVEKEGKKILDVGTGCGIIALILAQRNQEATIEGIDNDPASVEESSKNFRESSWHDRLSCRMKNFPEDLTGEGEKYDIIISNPPYFKSGIGVPSTQRERARHQGSLSVFSLIENSNKLLSENGILAIIFPSEFLNDVKKLCKNKGLGISRICKVRDNEKSGIKRVMLEITIKGNEGQPKEEILTLFRKEGDSRIPSLEYQEMCKDFYLKF